MRGGVSKRGGGRMGGWESSGGVGAGRGEGGPECGCTWLDCNEVFECVCVRVVDGAAPVGRGNVDRCVWGRFVDWIGKYEDKYGERFSQVLGAWSL